MNSLLVVHDQNQDENLDIWKIVVPEDKQIKTVLYRSFIAHRTALILGSKGPLVGSENLLLERDAG